MCREAVEGLVLVDAQNERIDVLAHRTGEVGERLAPAESDLVAGEVEACTSQLRDAALETDPRTERRLFEDEGHYAAGESVRGDAPLMSGLQARGLREQVRELVGGEVDQVEEMFHGSSLQVLRSSSLQVVAPVSPDLTT